MVQFSKHSYQQWLQKKPKICKALLHFVNAELHNQASNDPEEKKASGAKRKKCW